MRIRGTCVAREGIGVLIRGPAGSGKSALALRLVRHAGFRLVADDIVEFADGVASAPAAIGGLLEVRGLGIVRLPHAAARLALIAELGAADRLPHPRTDAATGLPAITVDASAVNAADVLALALDCLTRPELCVVGAFAA